MNDRSSQTSLWLKWVTLLAFLFIAFESMLLAAAFKGAWFILLAPGIVCLAKTIDVWREIRSEWDSRQL